MKQSVVRLIGAAIILAAPLAGAAANDAYPHKPIALQLGFPRARPPTRWRACWPSARRPGWASP